MPRPKKWMEQSASSALVHLVFQISLRYELQRRTVIWPSWPSVFKSSVYRLIAGAMIRGRRNALLVPQIGLGAWRPNEYVPATGEAGGQGSTARPDYLKRNERVPRLGTTAGPGMQQGTHIGSEVHA